MSGVIDLTRVPSPQVVEPLDFETILAAMKTDLLARYPAALDAVVLESEPAAKILEVCAYRELLVRQRVNDAARAIMLAYASGADLDHLAAGKEVARLAGETDARLRLRVQQANHLLAAAGPFGAYVQLALGADASIADVSAYSPAPGQVAVIVLAPQFLPEADVSPDKALLGSAAFPALAVPSGQAVILQGPTDPALLAVLSALNEEDTRPATDAVVVRAPSLKAYAIDATLYLYPGPDAATVLAQAGAALDAYLASVHHISYDVTRAGIIGALWSAGGVQDVALNAPSSNIEAGPADLVLCTGQALRAAAARIQ